jgi:hypothetical protein
MSNISLVRDAADLATIYTRQMVRFARAAHANTVYKEDLQEYAKLLPCLFLPHVTSKYKSNLFNIFSDYYHELKHGHEQLQLNYPDDTSVLIPDLLQK